MPPKDCGRDIWLNVAVRTGGLDGAATCSYGNLTEGIADDFARGMIEAAVHLLIDQLLKLARERDIHRPSVGAISTSVKFSYCWRRALPASTPSAYRALDHGDCHHLTCFGRLCRPCCLFQCPGVWRLPPLFTISPNGAAIIGAWGDSPGDGAYRASAITSKLHSPAMRGLAAAMLPCAAWAAAPQRRAHRHSSNDFVDASLNGDVHREETAWAVPD